MIVSRIGIQRECITIGTEDDLYSLMTSLIEDFSLQGLRTPCWVLVDEAQFLSAKQVEQLGLVVDNLNINVMCYGLRTDFLSRMFEGSKRLMELADEIDEIKTSCSCGRKAIVNARFHNGEITTEGEQIMIGGNETYVPLCRKCYFDALVRSTLSDE
jgi:thymidine kinase